jgi:glutamate carboxypeptidase
LNVKGKPAHSSQIFNEQNGFGAIFEATRIIDQFRVKLAAQPHVTFNPGFILGGSNMLTEFSNSKGKSYGKNSRIANSVIVKGDMRSLLPQQLSTKRNMQTIVSKSLSRTQATLSFFSGYPSMKASKGNRQLLRFYSQVNQDLGGSAIHAIHPKEVGASAIAFVSDDVDMALDGLGLVNTKHDFDEEASNVELLKTQIKRITLLLLRLNTLQE